MQPPEGPGRAGFYRPEPSCGWGRVALCVFLLSDRREHGRVPARDVHRSCAAGPHAVVAQEAEGEPGFPL